MVYGVESFAETLAAERARGVPVVGIGADEVEAYAPHIVNVRGHRVAFLAATQILDAHLVDDWSAGPGKPGLASALRVDRLVQAVAAARARADTVAVYLHWGVERRQCATEAQRTLARQLVDAGADIVVGSHAHQLLGGGRLGDAVVHYGLGNFAFSARHAADRETGVFLVTVTGPRVDGYRWVPARIVDRQPVPLDASEASAAVARWESLRDCTDLTP
jgi:poly-gamma-glutamate synthesis protein (capsule biosynthesis protein)